MESVSIAGISIFRPRPISEIRIRRAIISFLLKNKYPNVIEDDQKINEITQAIYEFCFNLFREAVEKIYSSVLAH